MLTDKEGELIGQFTFTRKLQIFIIKNALRLRCCNPSVRLVPSSLSFPFKTVDIFIDNLPRPPRLVFSLSSHYCAYNIPYPRLIFHSAALQFRSVVLRPRSNLPLRPSFRFVRPLPAPFPFMRTILILFRSAISILHTSHRGRSRP